MRSDLRLRLSEITKSLSSDEMRVTRVTGVTGPARHTLSHVSVTRSAPEKAQQNQSVTRVTRVTPSKMRGEDLRHTSGRVAAVVTERVTQPRVDLEDWLAFFDERAGIMEFDGGLDRAGAEKRAIAATVAVLGPKP